MNEQDSRKSFCSYRTLSAARSEQTHLPGFAVGGPVLGALMIMAGGCANPAKGAVQLLGLGSLRYIGRISYSLYLWHWPIVVIMPDITGRPLNVTDKVLVALLTFVLSVLTFHLLERPIREHKSPTSRPGKDLTLGWLVITGTASVCVFFMFFLSPTSTAAAQQVPTAPVGDVERLVAEGAQLKQLPPQVIASLPGIKQREGQLTCIEGPFTVQPHPCTFGDATSPREVVLLGDSHALQWTPTFDLLGREQGFKLTSFSKAACTPEPYSNIDDHLKRIYTECEQWRELVHRRYPDAQAPSSHRFCRRIRRCKRPSRRRPGQAVHRRRHRVRPDRRFARPLQGHAGVPEQKGRQRCRVCNATQAGAVQGQHPQRPRTGSHQSWWHLRRYRRLVLHRRRLPRCGERHCRLHRWQPRVGHLRPLAGAQVRRSIAPRAQLKHQEQTPLRQTGGGAFFFLVKFLSF